MQYNTITQYQFNTSLFSCVETWIECELCDSIVSCHLFCYILLILYVFLLNLDLKYFLIQFPLSTYLKMQHDQCMHFVSTIFCWYCSSIANFQLMYCNTITRASVLYCNTKQQDLFSLGCWDIHLLIFWGHIPLEVVLHCRSSSF